MAIDRPEAIDDASACGPQLSGGRRRTAFLPREEWAQPRGRKSAGAVAAQAIEASAGLRLDQAITEAAWLAGAPDEKDTDCDPSRPGVRRLARLRPPRCRPSLPSSGESAPSTPTLRQFGSFDRRARPDMSRCGAPARAQAGRPSWSDQPFSDRGRWRLSLCSRPKTR